MADKGIPVWRLVTHHESKEEALRWSEQTGVIAIGWGKIGHIGQKGYRSAEEIGQAIRDSYPGLGNWGNGKICLWEFFVEMGKGDLVILSADRGRQAVMEVEGDYTFKNCPKSLGDYEHQRKATVLPIDPDALWFAAGGEARAGHSTRWTLMKCAKPISAGEKSKLMRVRSA